ncbi:hypothetical protein Dxin01_00099 [Deinococcus xinjiangensis]|uniref:AAA+ ATPase domain-containing protein n=1 Tax=Deinococcus xinjiangensis TaxID=457454 RepID=A0ABP9VAU2_9DEIO
MTLTSSKPAPAGYTAVLNQLGQNLYVPTAEYDLVSKLLDRGQNIFLAGPKGTAKTEFAWAVFNERGAGHPSSAIFQAEFGAIASGDELDGYRTIDNDGKLVNIPSEFLKAIQHAASGNQSYLIADELNRVLTASALNKGLRLWSNQREYVSDLSGILHVDSNLFTVATANIGYRGTVPLNEALLDRFTAIEVAPLKGKALQYMLEERFPAVSASDVNKIVMLSDESWKAWENDRDGELLPITTRDAQRIMINVDVGLSVKDAARRALVGSLVIQNKGIEAVEALDTFIKGKLGV